MHLKVAKMAPAWSLVEMCLGSGDPGNSEMITVVRKIMVPVARCSMEPASKF